MARVVRQRQPILRAQDTDPRAGKAGANSFYLEDMGTAHQVLGNLMTFGNIIRIPDIGAGSRDVIRLTNSAH